MGEPAGRKVASKKESKSDEFKALVELSFVGLFSAVAISTNHEHWLKEASEVRPITGPILRYIESLPAKDLARLRRYLNPALFAIGCAAVIGPDLAYEVKIRKYEAAQANAKQRQGQSVAQDTGAYRPGDGGGRSGGQGAHSSQNANGNVDERPTPPSDLLGVTI